MVADVYLNQGADPLRNLARLCRLHSGTIQRRGRAAGSWAGLLSAQSLAANGCLFDERQNPGLGERFLDPIAAEVNQLQRRLIQVRDAAVHAKEPGHPCRGCHMDHL